MQAQRPETDPAFSPVFWLLPHPGTNGYVSSWGAMLSGTAPRAVEV